MAAATGVERVALGAASRAVRAAAGPTAAPPCGVAPVVLAGAATAPAPIAVGQALTMVARRPREGGSAGARPAQEATPKVGATGVPLRRPVVAVAAAAGVPAVETGAPKAEQGVAQGEGASAKAGVPPPRLALDVAPRVPETTGGTPPGMVATAAAIRRLETVGATPPLGA